jgi:hypothetical protein
MFSLPVAKNTIIDLHVILVKKPSWESPIYDLHIYTGLGTILLSYKNSYRTSVVQPSYMQHVQEVFKNMLHITSISFYLYWYHQVLIMLLCWKLLVFIYQDSSHFECATVYVEAYPIVMGHPSCCTLMT